MREYYSRKLSEFDIYHVVSRGTGRQIVFEDDGDRESFVKLLGIGAREHAIEVLAWCLMDNHIHLLLHADLESISRFMQYVLSIYAQAFNEKHSRVGHLFQGRFNSEPIDSEAYLIAAIRYIHQNPQKAGVSSVESYHWSSYGEYIGHPIVTSTQLVLGICGSLDDFRRIHERETNDMFLEPDDGKGARALKQSLRLATEELGHSPSSVKGLPRAERNSCIFRLLQLGLSVRQIERLTGVSRGTIQHLRKAL